MDKVSHKGCRHRVSSIVFPGSVVNCTICVYETHDLNDIRKDTWKDCSNEGEQNCNTADKTNAQTRVCCNFAAEPPLVVSIVTREYIALFDDSFVLSNPQSRDRFYICTECGITESISGEAKCFQESRFHILYIMERLNFQLSTAATQNVASTYCTLATSMLYSA